MDKPQLLEDWTRVAQSVRKSGLKSWGKQGESGPPSEIKSTLMDNEYQLFRHIWGCLTNGTPKFHALHLFLPYQSCRCMGYPSFRHAQIRVFYMWHWHPMKPLYFDCQISNLPGKNRAKSTTSDKPTKVVLRLHTLLELRVPMDPTNGNCVIKWGIPRINSLPTLSILNGKISLNQ